MSNADWWAQKLGNTQPVQQGRPVPNIPMPPSQQPMTPMPTFQQQPSAGRAQSASQVLSCPECGSGNYMSVAGTAPRCFDCGYPIEQSGSRYGNLSTARVEGAAQSARGNDTKSNWNPQGIIGTIN